MDDGKYVAKDQFQAHSDYITRVSYSPDGAYLCTCSADSTSKIYHRASQSPVLIKGHSKWVWDCAFSADSAYLLTASSDCTARLWETATGDPVAVYSGHGKAVTCIALNDVAF